MSKTRRGGPGVLAWRPLSPTGWLVLGLFLSQGLQFAVQVWSNSGNYLYSDNRFYETPAWSLASGHGLSIPRAEWEDPFLTAAYLDRYPGGDATHIPAATFAPGYAWYLALVYSFAGRSRLAAVLANGPLLGITVAAFAALVFLCLPSDRARRIALALGAVFPFWAFWAARIMSDTLCNALLATATVLWLRRRSEAGGLVLIGLLMGGVILTRPYAALLPLCVVLAEAVGRRWREARRALLVTLISSACLGLWVARNYVLFGVPLITGMGLGFNIWQASYEAENGRFANVDSRAFHAELARLEIGDAHVVGAHQRFMEVVRSRVKERSLTHLRGILTGIPRLWIPQGRRSGIGPRIVLGLWFGALFLFMIVGAWRAIRERDILLNAMILPVVYYTAVFMALHIESRYVLPVRPMGFILAAYGIDWLLRARGNRDGDDLRGARHASIG